jgi:hypothetical protein
MATVSESLPNFDITQIDNRPREASAVSWAAVFAGAIAAAVLSLILILLGTGIGLTMVSPWEDNPSATATGLSTVLWLTFVQIAASILGGYLAGRLRSRWLSVHTHEVYFRDTAHSFLAWALGTLLMATLLSSAVGTVASAGLHVTGYRSAELDGEASHSGIARILDKPVHRNELERALGELVQ